MKATFKTKATRKFPTSLSEIRDLFGGEFNK